MTDKQDATTIKAITAAFDKLTEVESGLPGLCYKYGAISEDEIMQVKTNIIAAKWVLAGRWESARSRLARPRGDIPCKN
jgi:hypothetical protein